MLLSFVKTDFKNHYAIGAGGASLDYFKKQVARQGMIIGAVDVGSPKNIGWAIVKSSGNPVYGNDLNEFIKLFAEQSVNNPAALGFESPLFIPSRSDLNKVTSQRNGEAGKPWSAGAGATVTTIGIAIMDYTLSKLRKLVMDRPATLDWKNWPEGDELLVWEAFVSGANHGAKGEHWRDALTAAQGFIRAYPNLDNHNAVVEENVVSLAGMILARTGWCIPSKEILSSPTLVIRPNVVVTG